MSLTPKYIRTQLARMKPLLSSRSLEVLRKGQNRLGELMAFQYRKDVFVKEHNFSNFHGAWILPKDERREGVILYLHGGGYACGTLEYAKGFGSTLAVQCGMRVFCAAYRLAPENPCPAALEDALEAYRYLLAKGHAPEQISLCGESAGGGLCYALCLKLRQLGIPMPGCIIGISVWADLTCSGASYQSNQQADPSLTRDILQFYAKCYSQTPEDPLVSPLFGDLKDMPTSLLFVGGDEILLSDTQRLHEKLLSSGCNSQLVVTPQRWHAYILYGLDEDQKDFTVMNQFLNRFVAAERKLRWMRLDNAAKIYPAARRKHWSNIFRLSATLTEEVDVAVLQTALDVTVRRFPSIAARLRRGIFWYYLQQLPHAPAIQAEQSYPLPHMNPQDIRKCALRVVVYKNRIAVELFHALTDGTGALIFLKTLVAEYLQEKYGIAIPAQNGILGRLEAPSADELEDSFQKYAGPISASRRESNAWTLSGTPESPQFLHLTCFQIPVQPVLELAHTYHVSLTAFLCAVMLQALQTLQQEKVPNIRWRKPLKVLIPVNLRNLFPSKTLRNFALYTTPEITPRLGQYTFEEICKAVHHRMGLEINPKVMSTKIATNVGSERILAVKLMPLFLKNLVMKAIFDTVGERKSCLTLSNLGMVTVPEEMASYVQRFDFILGAQAASPYNCGVLSYDNTLTVNFIRNTREPDLEMHFFKALQSFGLPVTVESNQV